MNRDTFIFYRSFYEAIKELPNDTQLDVYNAIMEFSLNNKENNLTGLSKTIFCLIKPQLEASYKKFKNGKQPKQKQNRSKTEAKQKQNANNDNVECRIKNENDNENLKENLKENGFFGINTKINGINYDLGMIKTKSGAINFINNTIQMNSAENKQKIIEQIKKMPQTDFKEDIFNALIRIKDIIKEVLEQ